MPDKRSNLERNTNQRDADLQQTTPTCIRLEIAEWAIEATRRSRSIAELASSALGAVSRRLGAPNQRLEALKTDRRCSEGTHIAELAQRQTVGRSECASRARITCRLAIAGGNMAFVALRATLRT